MIPGRESKIFDKIILELFRPTGFKLRRTGLGDWVSIQSNLKRDQIAINHAKQAHSNVE